MILRTTHFGENCPESIDLVPESLRVLEEGLSCYGPGKRAFASD